MFHHTGGRAAQRLRDTAKIDDDSLDAISFAFDLRHEAFHLVPIEGVGDILEVSATLRSCGGPT